MRVNGGGCMGNFVGYIIVGTVISWQARRRLELEHVPLGANRPSVGETAAKTAKSAPTPQRHPIKRPDFSHQNINHNAHFPSEKSSDRFRMAP